MRIFVFFMLFWALSPSINAQPALDDMPIVDSIHADYIQGVRFYNTESEITMPVLNLGSGRLVCTFDDHFGEFIDYYYTIKHCDKDWNFTKRIEVSDYLEGPEELQIEKFAASVNTVRHYVNYEFVFPNQDIQLRWSGNYILVVYDDEGSIVITRRFYVVDNTLPILVENTRPFGAGTFSTHQAYNVRLNIEEMNIRNPMQELYVQAFQNRLNERLTPFMQPSFIQGKYVIFNPMEQVIFPGYKEYRFFDLRTVLQPGENVNSIEISRTRATVLLDLDKRREEKSHFSTKESNGAFILRNFDLPRSNAKISSEYPDVIFTLKSDSPVNGDVYLIGEFNDFKRDPRFLMEYIPNQGIYNLEVPLKQGFYNYMYAVDTGEKDLDITVLEGSSFETENEYYFFCYYRPVGTDYDQLVGHVIYHQNSRF